MTQLLEWLAYTPVRDLPRLRAGRLAWRQRVDNADLSEEAKDLILETVAKTRLRRTEKADVVDDLLEHFSDAQAAGQEAVTRFGNPTAAARQIASAVKQGRGLVDQLASACLLALSTVVLLSAAVATLFHSQGLVPQVTPDYTTSSEVPDVVLVYAPFGETDFARRAANAANGAHNEDSEVLDSPEFRALMSRIYQATSQTVPAPAGELSSEHAALTSLAVWRVSGLLLYEIKRHLRRDEISESESALAAYDRLLKQVSVSGYYGALDSMWLQFKLYRDLGREFDLESLSDDALATMVAAIKQRSVRHRFVEPRRMAAWMIDSSGALSGPLFGLTPPGYRMIIGHSRDLGPLDWVMAPVAMLTERSRKQQISALAEMIAAINATPDDPQALNDIVSRVSSEGGYRVAIKVSRILTSQSSVMSDMRKAREALLAKLEEAIESTNESSYALSITTSTMLLR